MTIHAITLAESLSERCAWQIFNFGYNGPNPPYVRLGMKLSFQPMQLAPCFESFTRDRLLLRSKVSVSEHLSSYTAVLIRSAAFDEAFSRGYAGSAGLPIDQWLRLDTVRLHYLDVTTDGGELVSMPLNLLCTAAAIHLA